MLEVLKIGARCKFPAVVIPKCKGLWDVTLCRVLYGYGRFEGTLCLEVSCAARRHGWQKASHHWHTVIIFCLKIQALQSTECS